MIPQPELEKLEERPLIEEVTLLDIDALCSAVAAGNWGKLNGEDNCTPAAQGGGVLRMWEGAILSDCFDDRRIAFQSTCCPCYRFGKNMKRAGIGSCFLQGGSGNSSLNDCMHHLICPCCTLCQESRTLEMNNVQDGIWHGRGDRIHVGSSLSGDISKPRVQLNPPFVMSTKSPELHTSWKALDKSVTHPSTNALADHSTPLDPPSK